MAPATIQSLIAAHVASGVLVPLTCPKCGDVSHLRHDNPHIDNWHCFCQGPTAPIRMTAFSPIPHALYLCDNGACYCGLHLGSSAKHTGRDISGQEIYQIQPADHEVGTPPFKCESCQATFGRSVKQGVVRPVLVRRKSKSATEVHDYASR